MSLPPSNGSVFCGLRLSVGEDALGRVAFDFMINEVHIEDGADAAAVAGEVAAVVGENPLLGHAPFFQEVILRDAAVDMIPWFTFVEITNARCVLVGIDTTFPEAVHPDVEVENSVQLS